MAVIVRNPTIEELPTVWEVLCGAFGERPRERFRRQIWEDSTFALEQIRIAEVDGKIVSHVWVAERPVFYRGQTVLPMGGIGGVGTLPEFRGQGLATLLLEDAIAYMNRKGHAISMLFTGINPFYARLGWANFPEWRFRLTVRRLPNPDEMPSGYFVRPYEPDQDLPAVQTLYRKHIAALHLSLPHARPDAFWRDGHPQLLGLQVSHVVVAGMTNELVGYACAFPTDNGLRLSEFAFDPAHPFALEALAIALAQEAKAEGKEGVISGITSWLHPLPQKLAALTDATLHHEVSEGMMLRVNDLRKCLEAAQPLMEATLQATGVSWRGSFCFRLTQPEQVATIKVEGNTVSISDSDGAEVTLTVTPRQFCLLFFGAASATMWRDLVGANLSGDQTALLSFLFPPHPSVYFSGDHF
jgi:predicted N-acetyltransferase YhbS